MLLILDPTWRLKYRGLSNVLPDYHHLQTVVNVPSEHGLYCILIEEQSFDLILIRLSVCLISGKNKIFEDSII